ncbi:MAG: hypothetical protein AAFU38_20800 [Bacteroidota bacterium]
MPENTSTPPAEAAALHARRALVSDAAEGTGVRVYGPIPQDLRHAIARALQPYAERLLTVTIQPTPAQRLRT